MQYLKLILPIIAIAFFLLVTSGDKKDNWTANQLISTNTLASAIEKGKSPTILNIGPAGNIKSAYEIGAVNTPEKLEMLRKYLIPLDRKQEIVVYCGCCPFKNCPNIRPAMALLQELKFQQSRLLDIANNLKVDWIDKGYPMD